MTAQYKILAAPVANSMVVDINNILYALADLFDFSEASFLKKTRNHSRRIALICSKVGRLLKLDVDDMYDLITCALLHDNGIVVNSASLDYSQQYDAKRHCIIGEANAGYIPFRKERKDVLLYHHELYNGYGYFGKEKDEIPLLTQIISVANVTETLMQLGLDNSIVKRKVLLQKGKMFSPEIVEAFEAAESQLNFWLDLSDDRIDAASSDCYPVFKKEFSAHEFFDQLPFIEKLIESANFEVGKHLSRTAKKASILADYYSFDDERKGEFIIAAYMHDIGKLYISSEIILKKTKLIHYESEMLKMHIVYTKQALKLVNNFGDIAKIACRHHECLDGSGYPEGISGDQMSFDERLMAVLDTYQAFLEGRSNHLPENHNRAMSSMRKLASSNLIDGSIVEAFDDVFA